MPVVVYTGILTLVVAGSYRMFTRARDVPNLFAVMWSIWVLVAVVNFYGNYQNIKGKRAELVRQSPDPLANWGQEIGHNGNSLRMSKAGPRSPLTASKVGGGFPETRCGVGKRGCHDSNTAFIRHEIP